MGSEPMDTSINTTTPFQFYEDRLSTFDIWSTQIVPDKYQLSKAGFYYSGIGDKVICFSCHFELCQWEKTDNPFDEHYRHSSSCNFLKIIGYTPVTDTPVTSTRYPFSEKPVQSPLNPFNTPRSGFTFGGKSTFNTNCASGVLFGSQHPTTKNPSFKHE